MKKVLLTTTAVVFTAGFVSAGDYSMSGSIKLTYGSFGTGSAAATGGDDFTEEADLDIAATSSGGNISMTGTLELDEDGDPDVGPIAISSGALTFTYDNNDIGALALEAAADGEDDNYGDYSVAFAAGGIGVTYVKDQDSSDNSMAVTYSAGALSLSLTALDETGAVAAGNPATITTAGVKKTTVGATYVTGPYTIAVSGDDQTDQDWDSSVAMTTGDTTITVAADETNMMSVGIAYTNGAMTVSARQEFNNAAGDDSETEVSLSYTDGALTFSAASDSGQSGHYGDEAELLLSAAYTDGDVTVAAKGTDQDEMEVSVTFAF
jgi:outer membrane protein OmpU